MGAHRWPAGSGRGAPRWWQPRAGWGPGSPGRGRIVNSIDRHRLYGAIPFSIPLSPHAGELFEMLAGATALPPERVPPDLVTMNSIVCVRDTDTGAADTCDLVYPFDADRRPLGRSVAAPLGAAIFGRYVGEQASWRTARGERRVVIDTILYQPERAGHYDR